MIRLIALSLVLSGCALIPAPDYFEATPSYNEGTITGTTRPGNFATQGYGAALTWGWVMGGAQETADHDSRALDRIVVALRDTVQQATAEADALVVEKEDIAANLAAERALNAESLMRIDTQRDRIIEQNADLARKALLLDERWDRIEALKSERDELRADSGVSVTEGSAGALLALVVAVLGKMLHSERKH
jgi:hypothetical protein